MTDPCPICGEIDCGGVVYALMVERYAAGRDREHWRRIHDRADAPPPPTPEDIALRALIVRTGPCCP